MAIKNFRDQELAATPRARTRLLNAQAAVLERGLRDPQQNIVGGQFVDAGDTAGLNAAIDRRDAFNTDYQARAKAQAGFGSQTVTRGKPGGLRGGVQLGVGGNPAANPVAAAAPAPGMNGDPVYPGGPSFQSLMDPNLAGGNDAGGAPDANFQGAPSIVVQKAAQDFGVGDSRASGFRRTSAPKMSSTTLSDEFATTDEGLRNGGMVGKQRTVKQPGYMSGGKVRMPVDPIDLEDTRSPEEIIAQERAQQALQSAEGGGGMHRPTAAYPAAAPIPGYKWGPQAPTQAPVQAPARDGYRWDDPRGYACGGKVKKGMRGYAMGGQIGDEMEDDGRDTVDVRVREGEYMLNPETVAAFGGGDYEAGASVLDGIVTATTGEQPGPVPVNEAGEPVQQGLRNGGKMGYALSGGVQMDMFNGRGGAGIDPAEIARQRVEASRAAEAARQAQVAAEEAKWSQPRPAQPPPQPQATEIPKGARAAADAQNMKFNADAARNRAYGKFGEGVGKVANTLKPVANGLRTLGSAAASFPVYDTLAGMAAPDGKYYDIDPEQGIFDLRDLNGENWPVAMHAFAEDSGNRLLTAGAGLTGTIDDISRLAPGDGIAGAQAAYENFLAEKFGPQVLPQNRGKEPYRTGISELAAQFGGQSGAAPAQAQASAAVAPPADPYGRAFGGTVNGLRNPDTLYSATQAVPEGQQRIVQRTGGPGNEAIIREDINGVPTFTNVRQGGFDGSAANLQAEANQRAAEDVQIRAQQGQVVEQMRQNAPVYGDQAEARRAEAVDTARAAMVAASKAPKTKQQDVDQRVEERFQTPQVDEDGQVTGYVKDQGKKIAFYDAMVAYQQADPTFDFYSMDRSEQNAVFDSFEDIYADTLSAMKAAKAQGLPVFDTPRSGANGLRYLSDSNITIGDVWGPEATIGDYAAGIFSDAPINDGYVEDPLSKARIPARRAVRGLRGGMSGDSLLRYGIPGELE